MSVILVTGSYDHEIRFWEAWSGICSRTIARSGESGVSLNRLATSPDLLAAAIHKKVNVYEISSSSSTPDYRSSLSRVTSNVTSVSFHSQGRWLVTGSEDGTTKICQWDLRNTHLHRNYNNEAPVHLNQGDLISCDQTGRIRQWDLSENICTYKLTPTGDVPIRSVTLASDGSCLVSGNNKGKCYVWKINEEGLGLPRFQAVTKIQEYLTPYLVLSPDVKYLATCSADTTVKIWSISPNYESKLEKVLQATADSAYLVTASSDHTASLWEMASGETVRQYNGYHKRPFPTSPKKGGYDSNEARPDYLKIPTMKGTFPIRPG
ncbi:WD40 repeat-like protein [Lactifluus volemus]|nr:WD40 repeat-like protein [Lactifluus volemus]